MSKQISAEWKEVIDAEGLEEENTSLDPVRGNIKYSFDVDVALDNMDLSFSNYTPSRDAVEFFTLMRVVKGEEMEVPNDLMHYFMVDLIFGNIRRDQYPYKKFITDNIRINPRKIAIMTSRGLAKALSLDSKIMTPNGEYTMKNIKVGDELYDRNGEVHTVTAKSEIFNKKMYGLVLEDKTVIKMSMDHDNFASLIKFDGTKTEESVYTAEELFKLKTVDRARVFLPTVNRNAEFKEIEHSHDIKKLSKDCRIHNDRTIATRVPHEIQFGSAKDRKEYFIGLMLAQGVVRDEKTYFYTTNYYMLQDFCDLAKSLGCRLKISQIDIQGTDDKMFSVYVKSPFCIFHIGHQHHYKHRFEDRDLHVEVIEIIELPDEPSQCLTTSSPTKSFITDAWTVTHNSSIVTLFFPIYVAIKGKIPNFGNTSFIVGFGDSQQAGAKVQANTIRDMCEDSMFCKEYFESMRFTDEECEFVRKGDGTKKSRSFMYKVKGAAGGSVRGIRYKGERPQLIIFDDIIKNEADASSKIIMNKIRSMMYADAENALGGKKGKIIIINTPFNKMDPVYQALESGVWTPVCIPMCEKIDENTTKEEFVGAWESMHPYERIMERFLDAQGSNALREFNQELMLRISSNEDRMIQDDMMPSYNRSALMGSLSQYNIYVTTDFTSSEELGSDYSGIATWAVSNNSDYFLLDLCLRKQGLDAQYEETMRQALFWGGKNGRGATVGVEKDGNQTPHINALRERMMKRGEFFTFARQKNDKIGRVGIVSRLEGGNKHWRLRLMVPYFQNKKIWFPIELETTPDLIEMKRELRYTTWTSFGSGHDDGADLISMLGAMHIVYPTKSVDVSKKFTRGPGNVYSSNTIDSYESIDAGAGY